KKHMTGPYGSEYAAPLRGLVALVREVPSELVAGEADYSDLMLCIAVIEEQLQRWLDSGHGTLSGFPGRFRDPVLRLRIILSACSDEPLPQNASLLVFIADRDLRDSILLDIRAADDALSNREWKAATVLAGAAIEALLHWHLEQVPKPS